MLELIISLLLSLGINLGDDQSITVIDQQTGVSYGVGNTSVIQQGMNDDDPTPTIVYYLICDESGEYHLVRR